MSTAEIVRLLSTGFNSIDDAHLLAHVHCLHACSESKETGTKMKATLPPQVKVKPQQRIVKTEVATGEVTEQEVAEPEIAPRSSIAETCRESVTSDVLYESFGVYTNCRSNPTGDVEPSSSIVDGAEDDWPSHYENLPGIRPQLDREPYLNEEQLQSVLRRGKRNSSFQKRDSMDELPKHCSYVHGMRPARKDEPTTGPGKTENTYVERLSTDPREHQKETESEEDESEKDIYESIATFKPVRHSVVRPGEPISPYRPTEKSISVDHTAKEEISAKISGNEKKSSDHPSKENFGKRPSEEKILDRPNEEELQQINSPAIASALTLSLQASIDEEGEGGADKTVASPPAATTASTPKWKPLKDNQMRKGLAGIGKKLKVVSSNIAARMDSQDKETEGSSSSSDTWASAADIPKDIRRFTIDQVSLCLRLLNLGKYEDRFRERKVDGAFLRKTNQKMLVQHFQMDELEAEQLVMFARDQWRPR